MLNQPFIYGGEIMRLTGGRWIFHYKEDTETQAASGSMPGRLIISSELLIALYMICSQDTSLLSLDLMEADVCCLCQVFYFTFVCVILKVAFCQLQTSCLVIVIILFGETDDTAVITCCSVIKTQPAGEIHTLLEGCYNIAGTSHCSVFGTLLI